MILVKQGAKKVIFLTQNKKKLKYFEVADLYLAQYQSYIIHYMLILITCRAIPYQLYINIL
jgi:hypothetical protein